MWVLCTTNVQSNLPFCTISDIHLIILGGTSGGLRHAKVRKCTEYRTDIRKFPIAMLGATRSVEGYVYTCSIYHPKPGG